MQCLNNKA